MTQVPRLLDLVLSYSFPHFSLNQTAKLLNHLFRMFISFTSVLFSPVIDKNMIFRSEYFLWKKSDTKLNRIFKKEFIGPVFQK